MKAHKLRELTADELKNKHDELWSELFGMRVKHSLGQLENPIQLRDARRDIARVKTLLAEKGITETPSRRTARPAAAAAKPKAKKKATKSAKSGADK